MSLQKNDSDERFALGLVFALIALLVLGVLGFGVYKNMHGTKHVGHDSMAHTVDSDSARVLIENGVVKFYFASGQAELAPGASEALADVVADVKAGKRAVISGFADATGNPQNNDELAKQRALAVHDALVALGAAQENLDMEKPEAVQKAGDNAQARCVEVRLIR